MTGIREIIHLINLMTYNYLCIDLQHLCINTMLNTLVALWQWEKNVMVFHVPTRLINVEEWSGILFIWMMEIKNK